MGLFDRKKNNAKGSEADDSTVEYVGENGEEIRGRRVPGATAALYEQEAYRYVANYDRDEAIDELKRAFPNASERSIRDGVDRAFSRYNK